MVSFIFQTNAYEPYTSRSHIDHITVSKIAIQNDSRYGPDEISFTSALTSPKASSLPTPISPPFPLTAPTVGSKLLAMALICGNRLASGGARRALVPLGLGLTPSLCTKWGAKMVLYRVSYTWRKQVSTASRYTVPNAGLSSRSQVCKKRYFSQKMCLLGIRNGDFYSPDPVDSALSQPLQVDLK